LAETGLTPPQWIGWRRPGERAAVSGPAAPLSEVYCRCESKLRVPISGRRSGQALALGWACPSIGRSCLSVNNYLRQDTRGRADGPDGDWTFAGEACLAPTNARGRARPARWRLDICARRGRACPARLTATRRNRKTCGSPHPRSLSQSESPTWPLQAACPRGR
jgi:hypothetical protein